MCRWCDPETQQLLKELEKSAQEVVDKMREKDIKFADQRLKEENLGLTDSWKD